MRTGQGEGREIGVYSVGSEADGTCSNLWSFQPSACAAVQNPPATRAVENRGGGSRPGCRQNRELHSGGLGVRVMCKLDVEWLDGLVGWAEF